MTSSASKPAHGACASKSQLDSLTGVFYETQDDLASFESADSIPKPFDRLLNHEAHMTVTVEAFHHEMVRVAVHQTHLQGELPVPQRYTREITLTTMSHGVVQYGIVRLDPSALARPVWDEIVSEKIPLGRALINHRVLRDVQLCRLWKVVAGPALSRIMSLDAGEVTYGRTARIHCNTRPAIELLEIVRVPS